MRRRRVWAHRVEGFAVGCSDARLSIAQKVEHEITSGQAAWHREGRIGPALVIEGQAPEVERVDEQLGCALGQVSSTSRYLAS